MKKLATCLAVLATLSISSVALADEASPPPEKQQRGVITLPPYEIVGHPARPQASIAVSRIEPRLTLIELKQLFVERIEQSLLRGAF